MTSHDTESGRTRSEPQTPAITVTVPPARRELPHEQEVEDYGGGHIRVRHGRVDAWLLVVYAVLFVWALYYGFTYWGGLGPGLDLTR